MVAAGSVGCLLIMYAVTFSKYSKFVVFGKTVTVGNFSRNTYIFGNSVCDKLFLR